MTVYATRVKKCEHCGGMFQSRKNEDPKAFIARKYCSLKCFNLARKANNNCIECGNQKYVLPNGSRSSYCSECFHARGNRYARAPKNREKARLRGLTPKYRFTEFQRYCKSCSIDLTITFSQYENLISQGCYYCGNSLLSVTGYSLDRINSKGSYTFNNVLPCCGFCNRTKSDNLTVEQAQVMIHALLEYNKLHNFPFPERSCKLRRGNESEKNFLPGKESS